MVDFGSDLRKRTLFLCAALAFAIAASVLLRGRRARRAHLLFAAFAGDFALWYLAQSLYGFFQASIWARMTAVLSILLPHFAIRMFEGIVPSSHGPPSRLSRVAVVLAVPVTLVVFSPFYGHGYARGLVFFYVFGLIGAALAALAVRGQRSPSRAIKGRVRYLVVVGAFATIFSLCDFLWFIGAELPPFGAVLSVIFLFALAQSLRSERLLDLYELLGRLLVATALAFALAGIFYVCVTVIGRFNTMYLNAVLAAVVILVLFDPLRLKVEEKIHQLFFRERFALENAIAQARRRLMHTLEVDELGAIMVGALEASRRVTTAALYLRDENGRDFTRAGGFGLPAPENLARATIHALCERLVRSGAVSLEEVAQDVADGRGDVSEKEHVLAAGAVLGPLREALVLAVRTDTSELLGLLVVADERVRDAYSPEDVVLLESLAAQVGVVLENTRVYARLKTRDRLAALGQMAAGLAHEVKNPLGAIKGAAQLLAEPSPGAAPLDANAHEFLAIILEEVERLDRVVHSVLDYARPSAEEGAVTDVNAVIRRTGQILSSGGDKRRIDLQLDDTLPRARVDAEQLRQVLINLIQNAAQAMGDTAGMVTVTSRVRSGSAPWAGGDETAARRWVEVAVSDQGPGIGEHVLKNLFMPFFTTKDHGTGLGLAISQRIVQAAGGAIEVRTERGAGATFLVVLPAVEITPAEAMSHDEAAA